MPCTVDCLSTYACTTPFPVLDGAVFAPFVEIRLAGKLLTVGNQSAPDNNHACITSFQYGFTGGTIGFGATFELLDQGGVMYRDIIRAINKTITKGKEEASQITFDFGWIIKDCNGGVTKKTAEMLSGKKLHGIITEVDQTFEGGKVKLKFAIRGVQNGVPDVRKDGAIGSEDKKVTLKYALRKLFLENDPKFKVVEFKNKDGGELMFKDSGADAPGEGPKGCWPMDQQHQMAIARKWLSSIVTENKRGVLILYDPDKTGIIFQEAIKDDACCNGSLGTYIVNGGNCSPVLEFNPSIKWPKGFTTDSGAAPGGASSGANDDGVKPVDNIEKAGTQSQPTVQQHEIMWRNPDELASKSAVGNALHMDANRIYEWPLGFTAELKIIGDAFYSYPPSFMGATVSVVAINPFHIGQNCVWLAQPTCNSVLSNKRYVILGADHQISGGMFTTTLKLFLAQPNRDKDASAGLGCDGEAFGGALGSSEATDADKSTT